MFTSRNFGFTLMLVTAIALVGLYMMGTPRIVTAGAYMVFMITLREIIKATLDEVYAGHLRGTYLKIGGFLIFALVADVVLGYFAPTEASELIDLLTRAQALTGTVMILLLGIFFAKSAWKDIRDWLAKHTVGVPDVIQSLATLVLSSVFFALTIVQAPAALIGGVALAFVWLLAMTAETLYRYEEPFTFAVKQPLCTIAVIACLITGIAVTFTGKVHPLLEYLVVAESVGILVIVLMIIDYIAGWVSIAYRLRKRLNSSRD